MKAPRHPPRFEPGGEWQAELKERARRREQSLAMGAPQALERVRSGGAPVAPVGGAAPDEGEERERIKRLEHGSNLVRITGCSIETPAKAAP